MNRTQKGAWFTLGMGVLLLAFIGIVHASMFAPGDRLAGTDRVRLWIALIAVFTAVAVALVRKKQSPAEPGSDERDDTIKKNAVLACFASAWVSLVLASIIPAFVVGDGGSIPVFLLPIINISVLLTTLLVYSIAVLVQYGRTSKETDHE
jgi:peptidoglycan/LPS O-acetylase OafA/YrhL